MAPRRPTNNPWANRGAQQRAAGVNQQAQQGQAPYTNPIARAATMRGAAAGQGRPAPGIISTQKGIWQNNAQGMQQAQQAGAIRPQMQNQIQQHQQAGYGPQGQAYQNAVNNPGGNSPQRPGPWGSGFQPGGGGGGAAPPAPVPQPSGGGIQVPGQGPPPRGFLPVRPWQPQPQGPVNYDPNTGLPMGPNDYPDQGQGRGQPQGPPPMMDGPGSGFGQGPPPTQEWGPPPEDYIGIPWGPTEGGGSPGYGGDRQLGGPGGRVLPPPPPGGYPGDNWATEGQGPPQGGPPGQGNGYQGPGRGNNFNDLWAEYERRQDRGYSGDKFMQNHPKFAENYGQMNKMFDQYRGGGGRGGGGAPFRSSRSAAGGRGGYAAGQRRRGTTKRSRDDDNYERRSRGRRRGAR